MKYCIVWNDLSDNVLVLSNDHFSFSKNKDEMVCFRTKEEAYLVIQDIETRINNILQIDPKESCFKICETDYILNILLMKDIIK